MAIVLFLKEIFHLKTYLYMLGLIIAAATSCKQGKPAPEENIKGAEKPAVDYAAGGLVNLKNADALEDILCQTWDYKEDIADTDGMEITSDMEVLYRGYCFFKDGSVTKDPRGQLQVGKWQANTSVKPITISMEFENGKPELVQLGYLAPYEMILSKTVDKITQTTDLTAEGFRNVDAKNDPFYKQNVLWRIRAASSESDAQVKKRLKAMIHFYILFYDQKINAHSEKVTFLGLPSCYKWYASGIFIKKEEELSRKWMDCFYNKAQAMKAYRMADKLLENKYTWPKKGNWLQKNVAVLKQMEEAMGDTD